MKPFRKHPQTRDNRPLIQKQREINEQHEKAAESLGLPWRIVASSILHRYPTIAPDIPDWERDYSLVKDKIENINRQLYKDKTAGTAADIIADENPSFDEIAKTLPFTPASRITPADEANDRRSLSRKLPDSLYLIVKRNRKDNPWQFPQGKWIEGESLRKSAERINDRTVGNVSRWFVGNAPIGHYCYAYPPELQKSRKQYGAKIFYYRAQLLKGDIKLETRLYTDYAWVAKSEFDEYFDPNLAEYYRGLLI
eukprot:CAMPEP_0174819498 /NCGR_PEP_ID=MMETSP1107-20130205/2777_1 /TAXON_ID=36770 /ORGANISM="Paraphysomonas vestita, Strain GFlagA" /LENGTH=252 /DNA_ID=CAMNT_0016033115 /DNA_START=115 /DNA_END=873 /DNA_ORIENTATION=+